MSDDAPETRATYDVVHQHWELIEARPAPSPPARSATEAPASSTAPSAAPTVGSLRVQVCASIRTARIRARMTIAELAERAGCSTQCVADIERDVLPSGEAVRRIQDALQIKLLP